MEEEVVHGIGGQEVVSDDGVGQRFEELDVQVVIDIGTEESLLYTEVHKVQHLLALPSSIGLHILFHLRIAMQVFIEGRTDVARGIVVLAIGFLQDFHDIVPLVGIRLQMFMALSFALANAFVEQCFLVAVDFVERTFGNGQRSSDVVHLHGFDTFALKGVHGCRQYLFLQRESIVRQILCYFLHN